MALQVCVLSGGPTANKEKVALSHTFAFFTALVTPTHKCTIFTFLHSTQLSTKFMSQQLDAIM